MISRILTWKDGIAFYGDGKGRLQIEQVLLGKIWSLILTMVRWRCRLGSDVKEAVGCVTEVQEKGLDNKHGIAFVKVKR